MKVAVVVKNVFSDGYSSYVGTKVLTVDDSKTIAWILQKANVDFGGSTILVEILPVKEVE